MRKNAIAALISLILSAARRAACSDRLRPEGPRRRPARRSDQGETQTGDARRRRSAQGARRAGRAQRGSRHQPVIHAGLLPQIVLFWPLLALGTKRAHDRGHGTDWIVCMLALPGAFGVLLELVVAAEAVKGGLDASTLNLIVALDLLIVLPVLWASVELVFLRGMAGANRFGPDPLAAGRDRRAGADFSDGLRAGAAVVKPLATFPPHVTPEAAARFRQRFRRR